MNKPKLKETDWTVFYISGGFLILFILWSLIDSSMVDQAITASFDWSAKVFGGYWQLLMLANFVVALYLGLSKFGKVTLGNQEKPKYNYFRWLSMILVTLLASGGVFWAASEPMYHLMDTPPLFGDSSANIVDQALAQSFLHWGFLAWAILGTLGTIVMMYVHYTKGFPLRPRGLLFPIVGDRIYRKSVLGTSVDVFSILSIVAGTLGPLGFLGLQISYGLNHLYNVPDTMTTSILVVLLLTTIAAISAATGVDRGILTLSRYNVGFTIFLAILVLIIGPTLFIIDSFIGGMGSTLDNFFTMSLFRGDTAWLGSWTIFFWGWFIGYAPMLIVFISRISRGRTIRELVMTVGIAAPLVSNFWFSIVGGAGVFFEQKTPGSVSDALNAGGMEAAVMAITDQLPMGTWVGLGFLLVSIVFVATTADTMSYTVAATLTGNDEPKRWLRVFWALIFGVTAVLIMSIGENSVTSIQNTIVVTAVPVSIFLLPTIWLAPKIAHKMALDQRLIWVRTGRKPTFKN